MWRRSCICYSFQLSAIRLIGCVCGGGVADVEACLQSGCRRNSLAVLALDATAFARRRCGQLFQAGAQLLGQTQLIRSGSGTRGGSSSSGSANGHLDSGHHFRIANAHAHPASLTAGMGL